MTPSAKNPLRSAARRFLPTEVRHLLREMIYGPRVDEVALVHRLLSDGPKERVMVDVGAHHGASLEAFGRDGWNVLAFEPDPDNRAELERTCRGMKNVTIDPRALSDHASDEMPWFQSDVSTGISSLQAFHDSHALTGCVEVTTLAQALEAHKVEQVDFLKIDAEGLDLFVLRGNPWEWLAPQVIVCEFEDEKTNALGYSFRDLADYLVEHDYHVLVSEWYPITQYGGEHRWRRYVPYPCELVNVSAWGNLIAVRVRDTFWKLQDLAHR
ncbi:MAG: FkbM family methyltransferase [Myxococcota bacterium]|jgi:FkbM family methyltransferase|nr:FkbM family methyltransferase [Myxococcota bacterium]